MSDERDITPANDDAGPWNDLRRLTAARIGLKRSGASLATAPLLKFALAHAQARDAVHAPLDSAKLAADLGSSGLPVLQVTSAAEDRQQFLMRPDLGRRLAPGRMLAAGQAHDVVFVIADGLSARAAQTHAAPVLEGVLRILRQDDWRVAPLVIVEHGRVAIGDEIARQLKDDATVVLIGERPGLS